jgi:hypothetical protein
MCYWLQIYLYELGFFSKLQNRIRTDKCHAIQERREILKGEIIIISNFWRESKER